MIISFDLGSESFGGIQGPKRVPNVSDKESSKVLFLFELEGCLCLADLHLWKNVLDLWMLKDLSNDSSWVLMTTVTPPPMGMSWTEPYPTRTGEIVLAGDNHQTFYLYSFITQQYDTIEVVGLASNSFVTDYIENLVSLKDL
ncbi:hypothetical protein IFM89_004854 [Coptis chinensis]|uniref:F-box associated beta-propeller type 3 domain-containing protein n=1 Tax=Coptis chinensis TaxID=261450 RepID=A0A835LEF9_9MAGN|nr:hypothetical protein IFM89_004854 [Coptis chinensis]